MESVFSHHRRTAVILSGEGTAAAYLAGVLNSLTDAGVRVDCVVGKGAGALVAALAAIDSGSRLVGRDGLLARMSSRAPWRVRPIYAASAGLLAVSFAIFVSPLLFGVLALLTVPFAALGRFFTDAPSQSLVAPWLGYLLDRAEPLYLRSMVVPLIALCALWLLWLFRGIFRERRLPRAPEPFDLSRFSGWLTSNLWKAVRGTSTDELPRDRKALGDAYRKLLAGSLGQRGFMELVFYALDTDAGQEVPFTLLKERYSKKLRASRSSRSERSAEPIDLTHDSGGLFLDALMAALSPPGLVPSVPLRLPLGSSHGGEVHRFSGSLLASGSAFADAVAAGAEQVVFVSSSVPGDAATGNPLERVTEAALRRSLADQLSEANRFPDLPVFLIRPDKQRLSPYEIAGRAQIGGERLGLAALYAHGRRDALRLFVEPVLSEGGPAEHEPPPTGAAFQPDLPVGPQEL